MALIDRAAFLAACRRATLGVLSLLITFCYSQFAEADYKVFFTGPAQQMFGSAGLGSFATRDQCNAYRASRPAFEARNSQCRGYDAYTPPKASGQTQARPGTSGAPQSSQEANRLEAERIATEAAQQRQFQRDQQQLLQGLKGGAASPSGGLALKPAPSRGGNAREQLDCVARGSDSLRGGDWENRGDCRPVVPAVPEPPAPTRVTVGDEIPSDPAALAQFLSALTAKIADSRNTLREQELEVSTRSLDVSREEQKQAAASERPVGESDALRKAREALAKAKADREKTGVELERLQQQEATAKARAASGAK